MRLPSRYSQRFSVLLGLSVYLVGTLHAADVSSLQTALERISSSDLHQHINVLASDTFEGREAGSQGGKAAGAYITHHLQKIGVAVAGDDNSYYQHFGNDYRNILALLPGSDPTLKREVVLIGAHYDHVGFGDQTNSRGPTGYIHNGADDNASGTAGLLELIEALVSLPEKPKRSILFAFWDAEEKGLLGSEHWVSDSTVPIDQIRLVFNLDMIGRLRNQNLEVFGIRTATGLRRFLSEQNRSATLQLDFNWDNKRESDHYPFFQRHIPVLMMHTRKHDDYHRPSDDVDKINYEGVEQITRMMLRVVHAAVELPEIPRFRAEAINESQNDHRQAAKPLAPEPTRLGVSWETESDGQIFIRLNRVELGSPAEIAGLRIGDRLKSFGGRRIDGTHDFRTIVLAATNPVKIVVEREGSEKPLTFTAELNGKPRTIGMSWRVDSAEPNCVILTRVDSGSPADRAHLHANDRIYAVAGTSFRSSEEFHSLVTSHRPLDLLVEQQGRVHTVRLPLLPQRNDDPVEARKPSSGN